MSWDRGKEKSLGFTSYSRGSPDTYFCSKSKFLPNEYEKTAGLQCELELRHSLLGADTDLQAQAQPDSEVVADAENHRQR